MSAILNALSVLDRSLGNLEDAAIAQEQKALKLQQQDLFNGATNGYESNGNGHMNVDPAVLAQKLDITIERIEQVLREG